MQMGGQVNPGPGAGGGDVVIRRGRLTARTLHRLDVQGFDSVAEDRLAEVGRWRRMAFILCASVAAVGTALTSSALLLILALIAAVAAASPVHPFDLIYNHSVRYLTGTGPIPERGLPSRFACGVASVWLGATAWAFSTGHLAAGYVFGTVLSSVVLLVGTTDICLPSMAFRAVFGGPRQRHPGPSSVGPVR